MQITSTVIASSTTYQALFTPAAGGLREITVITPTNVKIRMKSATTNEVLMPAATTPIRFGVFNAQDLEVRGDSAAGFTIYCFAGALHPNI
jgi:hypothetical protein